ncbi:hypothetical protein LLE49_10425 [Alicyclobacillus tolerans]|uniref:SpaA isopeptide-forming pilin-related protein n=1 Tax=Alicyclobacillus tolerans TaxID=90970 RepID=UPI001F38E1E1|nr:SpaA isopeptide-forming pilin-related protein [Alicyclobacillus tolerans]MCF8565129.1 hypothetical protein [Alicyclobacillus tolerans]
MKRMLTGFVAVSVAVTTAIPMALAATTTSTTTASSTASSTTASASSATSSTSAKSNWFKMAIEVNGTTLSNPYGIAESDGSTVTTYIPMYYVDQALIKVGYKVTWDGISKTWKVTTPQQNLNFPSMQIGTGNTSITANGILIKKVNTIVQSDPEGGVKTTYMPIYYVAPLFQALGITAAWDGIHHVWSMSNDTSSSGASSSSTGGSSSGSSTTLTAPTIHLQQSNGTSSISVTGAVSQAMVTLYSTDGTSVVSTAADANGNATFYGVAPGSYYVEQTANGQSSGESNVIAVSKTVTPAPTPAVFASQSNGVWYVGVNDAAPNASLTLYSTNGNQIATATANQYGYATFNNVAQGGYYVVESLNGQNVQSSAVTVNEATTAPAPLATPSVSVSQGNGVSTITVSNAQPNATVTLYNSNGTVSQTATANSSGVATFDNVANGSYYVVQTSNGQQSAASNYVNVNATPAAQLATPNPTVTQSNGVGTISVSNMQPNATVTLYNSNTAVVQTVTADSSGNATFSNVPAGSYYVAQSYNGQTSAASNYVYVTAANSGAPAAPVIAVSQSNGVNTITVSDVEPNATVTLYTSNGQVSQTATADSTGFASFSNVQSGTYYAAQTVSGQTSSASNQVTV